MGWMTSDWAKRGEFWVPLVAVCTFLPSLCGGFVFDDLRLIVDNAYVQSPAFATRAFSTHFWDVSGAAPSVDTLRYYRPLVTSSYLWNWWLGVGQAWGFHLVNVLLHAFNTWLVLVVTRRLTTSATLALLCSLLFALHPTRAEAVAWVSGRPDLLMTAFILLTVQCVHWGRQRTARPLALVGVVFAFGAALLSKEPALATPLLLLAVTPNSSEPERTWHLSTVGLTAALGGAYLLLRAWLLPVSAPSLVWTPTQALITVSQYAERILWPWPLTFFYKPEEVGPTGWEASPWESSLGLVLVLGTLAWGAASWRRDRTAFWLLVAGLGFLGPLLNLTHTGARVPTSDRFLYLPLWLLALAACRSAASVVVLRPLPSARLIVAIACAGYAVANVTRSLDFATERTLWASELSAHPQNPVALRGLGTHALKGGNTQEAIRLLERSFAGPALRFRRLTTMDEDVDAYGRLLALKGNVLPDGAVLPLRELVQDGVDRLAGKPRTHHNQTLPIDWPDDALATDWVATHGEEAIARHLVVVASRLDVHEVSLSLLDAVSDELLHLAPNPFLIALAEARERRFERANARLAVIRERRFMMPKVVTDAALADCEARLATARSLFASARTLEPNGAALARARGLATLGAFYRGLLELQQADPSHPGVLPLYVQLLVSARLEQAALQVATQALGHEQATETVESIRAQLPPDLRALPTVDLTSGVTRAEAL